MVKAARARSAVRWVARLNDHVRVDHRFTHPNEAGHRALSGPTTASQKLYGSIIRFGPDTPRYPGLPGCRFAVSGRFQFLERGRPRFCRSGRLHETTKPILEIEKLVEGYIQEAIEFTEHLLRPLAQRFAFGG